MRARLSSYRRADVKDCEAFSYRYGATVARKFKASDKDLSDIVGSSLTEIFASEQDALALIAVPNDVEIDITVKTIQGEYSTESPIYGFEEEPGLLVTNVYGRRRVVVGYRTNSSLICGLELVELQTSMANHTPQPTPASRRS